MSDLEIEHPKQASANRSCLLLCGRDKADFAGEEACARPLEGIVGARLVGRAFAISSVPLRYGSIEQDFAEQNGRGVRQAKVTGEGFKHKALLSVQTELGQDVAKQSLGVVGLTLGRDGPLRSPEHVDQHDQCDDGQRREDRLERRRAFGEFFPDRAGELFNAFILQEEQDHAVPSTPVNPPFSRGEAGNSPLA